MSNATELTLSRTEFIRQMREYSNSSPRGVDHATWKRLKQVAMDLQSIEFIIVDEHNGCAFIEVHSRRNDGFRFTTKTHNSLQGFIDYIFATNNMVIDYNCCLDTSKALNDIASSAAKLNTAMSSITIDAANTMTAFGDTIKADWPTTAISSDMTDLYSKINSIQNTLDKMSIKENKKENKSMFNFDFGKVTSDAVRVSMYGIAVKNADGHYVSYDANTHSVMDVEILNVPADNFLYKMPVAIKDVKTGDVVIHNRVPMFVVEVHESTIKVVDIREGTEKEIYLTKNMFNFNYAVKVVSLMDMFNNEVKPSADNPFGNIGLYMMMFGENNDMSDILPLMLMSGNTNNFNPMMMYMLMKNNTNQDMLPLMMMMNMKN